MLTFDLEEKKRTPLAKIKVLGVGGAGGNAINYMIEAGVASAEFCAINTDAQALESSRAGKKIQIGVKSTKGLGAGANPEVGKRAAEEDIDKIAEVIADADIVFLTGGLGGGTGSGAIPVIVQALRDRNILTIVVVTKPFSFEGKRRTRIAEEALDKIKVIADTLIIVPNQKLLEVTDASTSMIDGFIMINQVLCQSVRSISEIISGEGHINVDFADVREIMKDQGLAVMGTGRASGPGGAKKAALDAISSPLLENMSIVGARAVLLNVTGGAKLGLHELSEAASVIYELADEEANIILGSVIDPSLDEEVAVTVIATGFPAGQPRPHHIPEKVILQPTFYAIKEPVPVAPVVQPEPQRVVEQPKVVELQKVPVQKIEKKEEQIVEKPQVVQFEPKVEVFSVAPVQSKSEESVILMPAIDMPRFAEVEEHHQLSEDEEFDLLIKEEELRAQEALAAAQATEAALAHLQVTVHEQPVVEAVEPEAVQAQAHELPAPSASININDLDVPSFMRKHLKEKRNS